MIAETQVLILAATALVFAVVSFGILGKKEEHKKGQPPVKTFDNIIDNLPNYTGKKNPSDPGYKSDKPVVGAQHYGLGPKDQSGTSSEDHIKQTLTQENPINVEDVVLVLREHPKKFGLILGSSTYENDLLEKAREYTTLIMDKRKKTFIDRLSS